MRRERGITLIALVITVIVMLILVGVTVTSAINGGLFSKAKNASTETENAKIFEQIQLAVVASKKFENEIQYEELLDLLSAKKNSGNFEEQSYNMYKEFIELMQQNKPVYAHFRLFGFDSDTIQTVDEHLDKDEILEAYCTLDGSSTSELMQSLKENEGITTEEEAKKYITDMLTDGANVTKRELGYELKEWKTNDLNRSKLLKELEPIMKDNNGIKKEEFGTNIIVKEENYIYNNNWAIVLKYGGVKVTILGTGEILGPEKEISEAIQDPIAGDITDNGIRTGSEYNPYLIASIEDLVAFSKSVNEGNTYQGKHVELSMDLDFRDSKSYKNANNTEFGDLNGDGTIKGIQEELTDENGKGFTPIGIGNEESQKSFNGNFDGNYHKIKNIYINNSENLYLALFAKTENNAVIENLGLERGKIINSNSGDTSTSLKKNYVAGIVGSDLDSNETSRTTIKNCFVDLDEIKGLNVSATTAAGIAISAKEINGCYNKTNITSNYKAYGLSENGITIMNSYNIGNITSTGVEDRTSYSTGIAHSGYVYSCYNYGAIVNEDGYACGINEFCEWGVSGIQNSCNLGDITSKGASAYGISMSVVGGDFYNLYNTGTILSDSGSAYGTVGQYTEYGDRRMRGKIINVGKVLGKSEATANTVCGKLSDSYYLAGQVYVDGVQKADDSYAKTQEEINALLKPILEVINTPTEGKNLGNAFVADTNNINNGLPILKWQVEH